MPSRAFVVAAIAAPERLIADLSGLGCRVVGQALFRDHHRFTAGELGSAAAAARAAGADAVVTTEKDAARLDAAALRTYTSLPVACLPMTVSVEPSGAFAEWLTGRLRSARLKRGIAA